MLHIFHFIDVLNPTIMSPIRWINETEIEMKPSYVQLTRKITPSNLNKMKQNHVSDLDSH